MDEHEYKKTSIEEFTKAARGYEGDKAGVYKMCRKDYPDILAEIQKEPFETLVDIGCGTAPMITLLAEEYPHAHYTGIDLTPAMIDVAKSKNMSNADFVVGDAENLPLRMRLSILLFVAKVSIITQILRHSLMGWHACLNQTDDLFFVM